MQFLLTAHDGTDEGALDRRLAARAAHLARGDRLVADGHLLFATVILDEQDRMVGSMMVLDYPSRAELDAWLETEPYVVQDVWRTIEVRPARVASWFAD